MRDLLRTAAGIARSLRIYYGPGRRAGLDRMHARFVGAGDLAFDIGAHVGDRIASLRRLGARVVALEPQPALAGTLRLLYGRDPHVLIEQAAAAAADGEADLYLNLANPTVSTASRAFLAAADGAAGWRGQRWERTIRVRQTTLDALIARHGLPRFCKIDVEGLEDQVLAGLSQPIPALSFEFTTIQRDVAAAALARCAGLGNYRFNAALGESQRLEHPRWLGAAAIAAWLDDLPDSANSGDLYAVQGRQGGAGIDVAID
jgi:FkbM family methyltransferase